MNIELIEKHRDINTDFNWWECTEEHTKEHLRSEYGFAMDELQWSGFCSQGDGASFTGAVWEFSTLINKHKELLDAAPVLCKLILADKADLSFRLVRGDSHYSHENTVAAEMSFNMTFADIFDDDDSPALLIERAVQTYVDINELGSFEKAILELLKDKMRKVHQDLEAEYEHLTSDEVVWETIVDNELHKEEA